METLWNLLKNMQIASYTKMNNLYMFGKWSWIQIPEKQFFTNGWNKSSAIVTTNITQSLKSQRVKDKSTNSVAKKVIQQSDLIIQSQMKVPIWESDSGFSNKTKI